MCRVGSLSHGDQRKLEVAILLALEPDILMFDEPTAGMSVDEVPVVLDLIHQVKRERNKTVLLVEHKMDVVRRWPTASSCCTTAPWSPTASPPRSCNRRSYRKPILEHHPKHA
jgi:ABC-type uncharacterized transport system ATPase subunit